MGGGGLGQLRGCFLRLPDQGGWLLGQRPSRAGSLSQSCPRRAAGQARPHPKNRTTPSQGGLPAHQADSLGWPQRGAQGRGLGVRTVWSSSQRLPAGLPTAGPARGRVAAAQPREATQPREALTV